MEETTTLQNFDLQLNETAKGFLNETAKWAYFLSILGYIGIAFIVLIALFAGAIFGYIGSMGNEMGAGAFNSLGGGTFITILYLIIAALYFFPVYYLNKFGVKTKVALQENNTELLTNSLKYLKSHFKFIGVMMLVVFALYVVVFLIVIVAGISTLA